MTSKDRPMVRKGSWRWAVQVAELTAWGTVILIALLLAVADFPEGEERVGIALAAGLGTWLLLFFRVLLFRALDHAWFPWAGVVVNLAFASAFFALWRGEIPSAQLIFVPVIVATGLIASLPAALAAAVLAAGSYYGLSEYLDRAPALLSWSVTGGVFLLAGSTAGLLSRELRAHYRGEQEEHRLATAVRHRLLAVLDAVDEAVVFRDRNGTARVVNRRAGELFGIDPDSYLGEPVVALLRDVARQTEEPEEFMESFQALRDDPELELRMNVEQIIPARRQLRMYSGPTFDDEGTLVGRIDVFTDISESVRRASEIQRLYESARRTAESYQRGLLPRDMPKLPRTSVVAHYIPAAGERGVCGDLYDFIPLHDGRLAIVMGDVCGMGPEAASDAAMTRYSVRSLAMSSADPNELLFQLNEHVRVQTTQDRFVRVFLGVFDPERAVLRYANAGHVQPVLFRLRDRKVEWLGEGGLPLGIEEEVEFKVGRLELEPGDTLIGYSDGLTEATRFGRPFGQGKLSDIVSEYGVGSPGEIVQALRRALDAWTAGRDLRDDVALVVTQVVPDTTLAEPTRELVLPNEPERVPEVRRFVGAYLADLRAPVETSGEILLAVGEAAANAARHGRRTQGRSEIRVRCAMKGRDVTIVVADDGPGFSKDPTDEPELPDRYASGGRGLYLMREFMDEVDIAPTPEGTTVTLVRRVWPEG